jgi:hypothetical protein
MKRKKAKKYFLSIKKALNKQYLSNAISRNNDILSN